MAQQLITQVNKEDRNNNNFTTLQPDTNNIAVESSSVHSQSLWERLCCCLFRRSPHTHKPEDYKNDKSSGLSSTDDVDDNPYTTNLDPPPPVLEGNLLSPGPHGKQTLVLDLDETLVHSSFKPIPNPDFIIPVEIEDQVHKVYVLKRPHVDAFLEGVGKHFEVVVFTASLSKYADPVLDLLDPKRVITQRLFRESCSPYKGNFVKDMSRLGRSIRMVSIIDNSPTAYLFQPENAIPCESWFDDPNDTELLDFLPFLEELSKADNVRRFLKKSKNHTGKIDLDLFRK